MTNFRVSLLSLSLAACGPELLERAPVAERTDAIVGGMLAPQDTNVFQLIMTEQNGQMGICTATLIGSRTLLTAAHCIDGARSVLAHNAPSDTQIQFGLNTYRALQWRAHPNWNPNSPTLRSDIGIVLLERAVTNAMPKPWNIASFAGNTGRPIRAVGYGNTMPGSGSGTRRQVALTVRQISQELIYMGDGVSKGICQGDSGGPTFFTFPDGVERVVGVHSFTVGQECTFGADTRVDAFSSFVTQNLSMYEAPSCDRDGRCATNCNMPDYDCVCARDNICSTVCQMLPGGVDPDCPDCGANGLCATTACADPDPDCIAEGQACSAQTQCINRECRNDPQNPQPYCTRTCTQASQCLEGFDCTNGFCLKRQLPVIENRMPCQIGTNICGMGAVCTGASQESSVCEFTCRSNVDCADGWTCVSGYNGFRFCQEPPKPKIFLPLANVASTAAKTGCASVSELSLVAWLAALALLRARR